MLWGVAYDSFDNLTPSKLKPFKNAYKKKLEYERDRMNIQAWYTGMYTARALGAVFGNKQYPSEPFGQNEDAEIDHVSDAERFAISADIFNHTHSTLTDAPK